MPHELTRVRSTKGRMSATVSCVRSSGSPRPADDGFRMPPETAWHERTLMAWPCRRELWGDQLVAAKVEYAGVANAVADCEPVTMVTSGPDDAGEARSALTSSVEVIELPLDDSWIRDNGPI